jgi:hypothetical protein
MRQKRMFADQSNGSLLSDCASGPDEGGQHLHLA